MGRTTLLRSRALGAGGRPPCTGAWLPLLPPPCPLSTRIRLPRTCRPLKEGGRPPTLNGCPRRSLQLGPVNLVGGCGRAHDALTEGAGCRAPTSADRELNGAYFGGFSRVTARCPAELHMFAANGHRWMRAWGGRWMTERDPLAH